MINAERRGHQEGAYLASLCSRRPRMFGLWLYTLALYSWWLMHAAGAAPIDPPEEFVAGFVPGFIQFFNYKE